MSLLSIVPNFWEEKSKEFTTYEVTTYDYKIFLDEIIFRYK